MLKYTQLKDNKRKSLRDIIPLAKPFTLVVEPSSLCNFKCAMCFQSTSTHNYFTRNKRNMPFELFERIIRQMSDWSGEKLKVLKLSLYGEPLLNPKFCDMVELARNSEIADRIETTSNVSLLSRKISERLVGNGLDYIRVSIYSPNQDRHESITNSKISIHTIHENLMVLREIKEKKNSQTPFVAVKMLDTYNSENEQFREMYEDVADEIYIDKPHNWVASDEKSFVQSLYGLENSNLINDFKQQNNDCAACGISFYTLSVRSNGDVSPCCVDYAGGTNVGNIEITPLRELWQGDAMRNFWTMQLLGENYKNSSCKNCDIYKSSYYSRDNVDGIPIERLSL